VSPRILLLFAAIAALPPRYAFDPEDLLAALRRGERAEGDREAVLASITAAELAEALRAAADAGIVREAELRPGEFLVVRTDRPAPAAVDLPPEIATPRPGWPPPIRQPDGELLGRALEVPVETVALRRAILDATQFTWAPEDYAALLDAASGGPRERGEPL
jgi:hypothetical protein